jgi:hypothetical protein
VAPLRLTSGLAFVQGDAVALLPGGGGPPAVQPLGFTPGAVRPTRDALWFWVADAALPTIVRWSPAGGLSAPTVAPGSHHLRLVALSDDEALVTTSGEDWSAGTTYRLTSTGTVTPLALPGGAFVFGGSWLP